MGAEPFFIIVHDVVDPSTYGLNSSETKSAFLSPIEPQIVGIEIKDDRIWSWTAAVTELGVVGRLEQISTALPRPFFQRSKFLRTRTPRLR